MSKLSLDYLGIINANIYHQLSPAQLTEKALERGEGILSDTGALCVMTGAYTGRSPNDRYIVDEPESHDSIDWGNSGGSQGSQGSNAGGSSQGGGFGSGFDDEQPF